MDQRRPFVVLSWNLFHGRDAPPDRSLFTTRSRLLRRTEDNGTYLQVNRSLRDEFIGLIASAEWSVCLLQECPPAWERPLADRCGAQSQRVLTSRNQLRGLTGLLARWNPDLVGSNEGGSNLILVRPPWQLAGRGSFLLNPLPRRGLLERRRMALARLTSGDEVVCVTSLHASAGDEPVAEREILRAATHARSWAAGGPWLLAGDFNVRPHSSTLFQTLEREHGLCCPTAPDAIDHVLGCGLRVASDSERWPSERREIVFAAGSSARRIRLSDHAPVEAAFVVEPQRIG